MMSFFPRGAATVCMPTTSVPTRWKERPPVGVAAAHGVAMKACIDRLQSEISKSTHWRRRLKPLGEDHRQPPSGQGSHPARRDKGVTLLSAGISSRNRPSRSERCCMSSAMQAAFKFSPCSRRSRYSESSIAERRKVLFCRQRSWAMRRFRSSSVSRAISDCSGVNVMAPQHAGRWLIDS